MSKKEKKIEEINLPPLVSYDDLKTLLKEEFLERDYGRKCLVSEILRCISISEKTQEYTRKIRNLNYYIIALNLIYFVSVCFESTKKYFLILVLVVFFIKISIFFREKNREKS